MQTNDIIFYKLGKIVLLPGILGAIFLRGIGQAGLAYFPDCVFLKYTGLLCPGCGGTRAAYYLAAGEAVKSFLCHPFVPYAAAVYLIFMLVFFFRKHFGKKKYYPIKIERYVYIGVAILLLQFVVKAVMLIFFHIRWI